MATLYEITGIYKRLEQALYDPEYTEYGEALYETLAAVDGEFESKAEGYAKILRHLQADGAALREEETRMAERRHALEARAAKLKETLQAAMETVGATKFKTPLFSFNIQNNPPSVDILDMRRIPAEYLVIREPEPDKQKIKAAINAGQNVPGAALKQTRGLRIR
ncbi:MAG: siphovirus Gp157 family protein [Oscillospiraceae bacterium]|jgi:chromosome segregation ATPase|nr:siphovirus Gp157 family protein [Oscillospiraceae bacterium]